MNDETTLPAAGGECPSDAELESLASGSTAGDALASHVASCARCSSMVGRRTRVDVTRRSQVVLGKAWLAPGTLVGRYRIVERLGHGGMGVVYHAIDSELDRPVALKLVRAHAADALDELTERLRRESRLQARASHPNVITVHDIGHDGDRVYVAMELALGGTLRAWLDHAPRGWRATVDVFRRAGEGLAAAHAAGLVHRDFKPDNVLVVEDGAVVTRVLVTDFGVARAVEAVEQFSAATPQTVDMTTPGALVGTPAYMAPEQLAAGSVDARTDVFAFGVGLWEALYGKRPYGGDSVTELVIAMAEPLRDPPPHDDRVPRWLQRALRRALAIAPADRYPSMTDLLRALDWRQHRRRTWIRIAAAGGLVAAAAVASGVLLTRTAPLPSPCELQPTTPLELQQATRRLRLAEIGDAAHSRDTLATALDVYLQTATKLRADVCHATPRPSNWQDRLLCIDRGEAQLAALMTVTVETTTERRNRFIRLRAPSPPYECATDAAGAVAEQYPSDDRRAEITSLLVDMEDAFVVAYTRPEEAMRRLASLVERARRSGSQTVSLQLALYQELLRGRGVTSSDETLRDIAVAAERAGQYLVAAHTWLAIAAQVMKIDSKRGRDLLAECDVALNRAGNPPRERAMWDLKRAFLAAIASDPAETAHWMAAAEDAMTKGQVPQDTDYLAQLGDIEMRLGHTERAFELQKHTYDAVVMSGSIDSDPSGIRETYAAVLIARGQIDDARKLLEPFVAMAGPSEPVASNRATAVSVLASAYNELGDGADAIRIAETWQDAIVRDLGPRSLQAGRLAVEHATAALSLGRGAEGERASAMALETYIERFGADSYDTADARVLHGQALLKLDRNEAARDEIERGTNALIATAGELDPLTVQARVALADVELRLGQPAQALAAIESATRALDQITTGPDIRAAAELLLARALVASHRELPRARVLAEHALTMFRADPVGWATEITEAKALLGR